MGNHLQKSWYAKKDNPKWISTAFVSIIFVCMRKKNQIGYMNFL